MKTKPNPRDSKNLGATKSGAVPSHRNRSKDFARPGDKVKVNLAKQEYKGTIIETPIDEKGIILLKLETGYNIGIKKKDIINADDCLVFNDRIPLFF